MNCRQNIQLLTYADDVILVETKVDIRKATESLTYSVKTKKTKKNVTGH